jgi:outer membrane immunogenic protein
MKKSVVAGIVLGAFMAPAVAADMHVKAPILKAPPPVFSWTGCYLGGNLGGKWATTSGSVDVAAATGPGGASAAGSFPLSESTDSSVIGGGQVGCNYQNGTFVFGIEGDADWQNWSSSRTAGTAAPSPFVQGDTFDVSSKWQASLRGRIGYAQDRALFYLTGGIGWTNVQAGTNFIAIGGFPAAVTSDSATLAGGTFGGGIEYAIANPITLGAEARYTWYGSHTFNSGSLATVGFPLRGGPFTFAPATTTEKLNTLEILGKLNIKINWGGKY